MGGGGRVGSALTDQSVSLIVKCRAEAASHAAADFAAHSLWTGFLTSAAAVGAYKSVQVLSDCVRNSELLKNHARTNLL